MIIWNAIFVTDVFTIYFSGLKVRNDFKNLGLLTVGDVARLNEEEVRVLPVKEPQVNTVRSVLLEYATQIAKDASITPRHMATVSSEICICMGNSVMINFSYVSRMYVVYSAG